MERNKIQFKPLHEGMGFHPFSDGLPYAPESKAKASAPSTGTGAVSAGRPRFSTQTHTPTRTGMKTARQLQAMPQAPAPQIQPAREVPNLRITRSAPIAPTPRISPEIESAPLRERFFAYLLDTVIHASFWIGTNLAALFFFDFKIDGEIVQEHLGQFLAFFMISQWIFIALQEVLFETSLGKSFFNLEFKRNHRSLFLRSTVFMLGALAAGLGLYYRPQDHFGEIQLKQAHES
jgi:hypothetical protein